MIDAQALYTRFTPVRYRASRSFGVSKCPLILAAPMPALSRVCDGSDT